MNILLVTETYLPFIAGVSTSTDSIARFMALRGHAVTLISPSPVFEGAVAQQERLTFVRAPSLSDPVYAGKPMTVFPFGFPVIEKTLGNGTFDVVHIQEPGSLGVCALFAARKRKLPVVGALHFTPEQTARMIPGKPTRLVVPIVEAYIRFIYNRYNAVMVPTQTFVRYLDSIGVTTPKTVVSNGVDTQKFVPAEQNGTVRQRYGIPQGACVFFFLGRLDKDKNVGTLVEALPYTGKNVWLVVSGKGKEESVLKARATKLGVEKRIAWATTVTEPEMIALYHAADCFSIMSPYEIQSIVTLQAIASGLPVVAARAGALPELCRDGENGFLADTYDAGAVAEKMNTLASDPALRRKFGAKSRQMSLAHHKPTVLARLEALYKSLIPVASKPSVR